MENNMLANKRIGIIGKGGSGKSTVCVLMAKALQSCGYQVCVLDTDSTNTGIHDAFGIKRAPLTLLDYFGGSVSSGGRVSCPVDDPTPLMASNVYLSQIPGKYYSTDGQGLFLFQLAKKGDFGSGLGCDGPISKIVRDLRIHNFGQKPVTLIDVKAGLEDVARGIVTGMDWIISVVDPTSASIQIAKDLQEIISRIQAGDYPAPQHLESSELVEKAKQIYKKAKIKDSFVLLNRIQDEETRNSMEKLLKGEKLEVIGFISEDSSISRSWLEGRPLEGDRAKEDMMDAIRTLEKNIKYELGIYDYEDLADFC